MKLLDAMEPSISPKKPMDSMQPLKKPMDLMQPLKKPMSSMQPLKKPMDSMQPLKNPMGSMKPLKKPLTPWILINHRSQIQNTNLSLADIKLTGI